MPIIPIQLPIGLIGGIKCYCLNRHFTGWKYLYFDLDVVIVDNIDCFLNLQILALPVTLLTLIRGFFRAKSTLDHAV